jgi:GT2 family glycosyltransferase
MKVAIVILNWNGRKFLEKFLPSVIGCNSPYAQVVVADNASTDDSVVFVKNNYPQVQILQKAITML